MATYREGHQAFSRAAPSARRQMWSVMKFKWIGFLNHLFDERRYIASAASLSNAAELSKSCDLVGVVDGKVGTVRRSQMHAGWRSRRSVELRASSAVGLRWQAIFGSSDRLDRSTRRPALERPRLRSRGRALSGRERFYCAVSGRQ